MPLRNLMLVITGLFIATTGSWQAWAGSEYEKSTPEEPIPVSETLNKQSTSSVLRFAVHVSDIGKMDPHFAAGSQDRALADMIFSGLLRYQPGNAPRIEPDIAEKLPEFKLEKGRQVWTVNLKKGIFFHGSPDMPPYELTADDVVYSLNKSADKQTCAYAGDYDGLTIEKIDDYSIRIILEKPMSPTLFFPRLTNYGGGFIVSKKAIETLGYESFTMHPIGTGPFAFEEYIKAEKVILKRHDRYFRGRPLLEGVEIHFLPDRDVRLTALKEGRMDVVISDGDPNWEKQFNNDPNIILNTHGVGEVEAVFFNTAIKPLDDVRVRKAMAYALDREKFMATTSRDYVRACYSSVPADFLPGGLTRAETEKLGLQYNPDLTKARELLAEAGYPDGFSLDLVSSEKRLYRKLYEVLKEQLSSVGITCNIQIVPHSDMHKIIRSEPQPIVIYVAWRPNADAFLTRFFHSESIVVTGRLPDTNFSNYTAIDSLIEAARFEIIPEKQASLWAQAQIRILSDMAALPVMTTQTGYLRTPNVDYGHTLISTMALYPQFTEKTTIINPDS